MSAISTFNPFGRSKSLRSSTSSTLKISSTSTAQSALGTSNVSLFITNLRLLDLDLREDWPDITAVTFSTKDAQQNQKKRIQSVEWALYQLFAIWDPEDTRNKLQPFFPPLEPLQSLNLRAALFRCLDQAKKTGVLGRDTVLRKTMLDECKGEKLEEVLAVFSNVVLKKADQFDTSGRYESLAQQLALENFSYTGERTILSALIMAHKASLSTHLATKDYSRAKYNDFAELLNLNDQQISQRQKQLEQAAESDGNHAVISERDSRSLQNRLRKNWSGSNEWLETILYGDNRPNREGLLATRFDVLWQQVENGTISEAESTDHAGLLEQLNTRVEDQENRLARWQYFSRSLTNNGTKSPIKKPQPIHVEEKGIDLDFNSHKSLQVGTYTQENAAVADDASLDEYTLLIEKTQHSLRDISKPKVQATHSKTRPTTFQYSAGMNDMSVTNNEGSEPATDTQQPLGITSKPECEFLPRMQDFEERDNPRSLYEEAAYEVSTPVPIVGDALNTPRSRLSRRPISIGTSSVLRPKETSADLIGERLSDAATLTPGTHNTFQISTSRGLMTPNRPASVAVVPTLDEEEMDDDTPSTIKTRRTTPPRSRTLPTSPLTAKIEEPQELKETIMPELDQAEQILDSMSAASPSPMKMRRTLSLAERTRLTMSRTSNLKYSESNEFDDLPDISRLTLNPKATPAKLARGPTEEEKHADLIERTRKSMAGFEAAQKKAQLERRKSVKEEKKKEQQRQSTFFPKVNEEDELVEEPPTPAVDREVLMESDVDYASVFMSRPRIATSPAALDRRALGDGEEDEDEEL